MTVAGRPLPERSGQMSLLRRSLLPLALVTATIALFGLLSVALPQPTQAAAFVVTKTADTNDGDCSAADCSLREAVVAANAALGPDTITVPPGTYILTLAGTGEEAAATGDLDVTDDVTIIGFDTRQTIIDGDGADRVFEINADVTATIRSLWVRNGSALNGVSIQNAGNLTLSDVLVRENTADSSTTANGGGVEKSGTLVLLSSEVEFNTTAGSGAGLNNTGDLTITDSTLRQNTADVSGGGINQSSAGNLTISGNTISENSATKNGGAIDAGGAVTLTRSTINGNTASDDGGALIVLSGGTTSLTHSTLSANNAVDGDGLRLLSGGSADLQSTIVAANPSGGDCSGSITSLGTNLDSDGTCALAAAGDLSTVSASLGGLEDNGGPTLTHALLSSSPAIDAASPPTAPATDQRGLPRVPAAPDIGAFERNLIDLIVTVEWAPLDPELLAAAFLHVAVRNQGPDAAGDVDLTLILPAGLIVESLPAGCQSQEAAVTCELGDMLVGDSADLAIGITPTVLGPATVSASLTAIGDDQQLEDNTAEATANVQPQTTVDVTLAAGWTLAGWQGASLDVGEAAAGIASQLTSIFVFDVVAQTFLQYRPTSPPVLNDLKTLEPGQAVWLFINDPDGAVWQQPCGDLLPAVQLRAGANLVAWLGEDGISVVDAVASLGEALDKLFLWDTASQGFLSFNPALPDSLAHFNTAQTLALGAGVWLLMKQDTTWEFGTP